MHVHMSPATRRSLVNFGDRVGTANAYLIYRADGRGNDCRALRQYLARVLLGRISRIRLVDPMKRTSHESWPAEWSPR
jgi:hypothetical protein